MFKIYTPNDVLDDDTIKALLVSLVVPVYNTSSYLENCLNSLLNQSHKCLQVILVNDGSTDESELICLKFCAIDSRFVYIKKENGGLSSARNAGLEQAQGEFIGFVDSDDFVSPTFIEKLLRACILHQSMVSSCGRWVIFDNNQAPMFQFSGIQIWEEEALVKRFLHWNGLDGSVWDKLFHRDLLPLLKFSLGRISEDLPITCAILIKSKRLVHVGEALYHYVQRGSSITNLGFFPSKISVLDSTREIKEMVSKAYPILTNRAKAYHWHHLLLLRFMLIGQEGVYFYECRDLENEIKDEIGGILFSPHLSTKNKIKMTVLLFTPFLYHVVFVGFKRFLFGNNLKTDKR